MEWKNGDFLLSDDTELINVDKVFEMLSVTYWASNRPKNVVAESIKNSLNFGLYHNGVQVGFTRVITDKVVFSYFMDVIIDERFRGKGIGKWMLDRILEHPDIVNTKQALATRDAHGFYEHFGFVRGEFMKRPDNLRSK